MKSRFPKRLPPLAALMLSVVWISGYSQTSWRETPAFRDGYERTVRLLRERPHAGRRRRLRDEVEILFMGGNLQSSSLDGPAARLEHAALEVLRGTCCPEFGACVTPARGASVRGRVGAAVAAAANQTGAPTEASALGPVAGALASVVDAVPSRCACGSTGIDGVLSCAGLD